MVGRLFVRYLTTRAKRRRLSRTTYKRTTFRVLSSQTSLSSTSNDEKKVTNTNHHVPKKKPWTFSKEAATAPIDLPVSSRWYAVPPANAVHLSIGSVYCYSMWTPGITKAVGVIAASSADLTQAAIVPVFSASAVVLGMTTAGLGAWVEKVGPRHAALVGSVLWGSALVTTAVGVHYHSLPALYAGYSLLGGIGWGCMYLAPVTTVMKFFPDKRGLATGIALSAFGTGAAIAPAIIHGTMEFFAVPPDFIGPLQEHVASSSSKDSDSYVSLSTLSDGSQVVANHSAMGEPGTPVVVATESDVAKFGTAGLSPGAYVLGTGDTGTAKALASLGVFYGGLGILGARFMTSPHPEWSPTKSKSDDKTDKSAGTIEAKTTPVVTAAASHNIGLPVDYVMKQTWQFPLLWLSVFGNAAGGLALLSSSKLMLTDIWAGFAPDVVNGSFAMGYVSALGVGMAAGRFGWSALSDYLGRRNTYALFGLGIPVVGLAPWLTHWALHAAEAGDPASSIPLLLSVFCGGSVLAITFYGGIFSVLPAYIADLFGQKHAGAIHGKLLTAWAASAVVGPMGLTYLRSQAAQTATYDLLGKVEDPAAFEQAFGCSLMDMETIQTLIDAKTITISRLMELAPVGTVDPTPFLYDTTCYAAAGLMTIESHL